MGFNLSTRNQVWLIFSIRPHQDDNSALEPSQADKPLLAIRFPIVLSGEHRLIENAIALRQIDPMFAQVELSLDGVIAHGGYLAYMHLLVRASVSPNKQLQRTVTRRRGRAARAPFHYARASRWTARHAAAELRR
jgi:hypothetical protein